MQRCLLFKCLLTGFILLLRTDVRYNLVFVLVRCPLQTDVRYTFLKDYKEAVKILKSGLQDVHYSQFV